eukprot:7185795-Pyramimonas_sp.AAC.1
MPPKWRLHLLEIAELRETIETSTYSELKCAAKEDAESPSTQTPGPSSKTQSPSSQAQSASTTQSASPTQSA